MGDPQHLGEEGGGIEGAFAPLFRLEAVDLELVFRVNEADHVDHAQRENEQVVGLGGGDGDRVVARRLADPDRRGGPVVEGYRHLFGVGDIVKVHQLDLSPLFQVRELEPPEDILGVPPVIGARRPFGDNDLLDGGETLEEGDDGFDGVNVGVGVNLFEAWEEDLDDDGFLALQLDFASQNVESPEDVFFPFSQLHKGESLHWGDPYQNRSYDNGEPERCQPGP